MILGLLSTYRVGQTVNYFSAAQNGWVSGVIVGFNPDGSVNLNNESGVPVENLTSSPTLVQMPRVRSRHFNHSDRNDSMKENHRQ